MRIDTDGNIEFSADENQELMDQLQIPPHEYDDPPVELEYLEEEDDTVTIKATNTKTGKSVLLEFGREVE
jgi:phosphoribosylamine-glycine ligase